MLLDIKNKICLLKADPVSLVYVCAANNNGIVFWCGNNKKDKQGNIFIYHKGTNDYNLISTGAVELTTIDNVLSLGKAERVIKKRQNGRIVADLLSTKDCIFFLDDSEYNNNFVRVRNANKTLVPYCSIDNFSSMQNGAAIQKFFNQALTANSVNFKKNIFDCINYFYTPSPEVLIEHIRKKVIYYKVKIKFLTLESEIKFAKETLDLLVPIYEGIFMKLHPSLLAQEEGTYQKEIVRQRNEEINLLRAKYAELAVSKIVDAYKNNSSSVNPEHKNIINQYSKFYYSLSIEEQKAEKHNLDYAILERKRIQQNIFSTQNVSYLSQQESVEEVVLPNLSSNKNSQNNNHK